MKILVVDDDPDLLSLVGFALTQSGFVVVKAADVPSALQVFAAESPDLAILDINLPGGSGFDICDGDPQAVAYPGDDADGARRGGRPGARARPRRGRLPHQALQSAHAAGASRGRCCDARDSRRAASMTVGSLRLDLEAHVLHRRRGAACQADEARDRACCRS